MCKLVPPFYYVRQKKKFVYFNGMSKKLVFSFKRLVNQAIRADISPSSALGKIAVTLLPHSRDLDDIPTDKTDVN